MSNQTEPNYDHPDCFQTFHELSESKKWEVYRKLKEDAEHLHSYCAEELAIEQDDDCRYYLEYIHNILSAATGRK